MHLNIEILEAEGGKSETPVFSNVLKLYKVEILTCLNQRMILIVFITYLISARNADFSLSFTATKLILRVSFRQNAPGIFTVACT